VSGGCGVSAPPRARAVLRRAMDRRSAAIDAWEAEGRELERRLLEVAQALLAHRATRAALVPMPGRLPVRCVAIGDLEHIRAMVRAEDISV